MLKDFARQAQISALEDTILNLSARLSSAVKTIEAAAARTATLVDKINMLTMQVAQQDERISELTARLQENETRTRRIDDERGGTAEYLDRMIVRYDGGIEDQETLRLGLARLEHRLNLHAEDTARSVTALLSRIELTLRTS
jgi:chromosome segregation ATPase